MTRRRAALGVLLAMGWTAALSASDSDDTPRPRIRVVPASFDFGKVKTRRTLRKDFRLQNLGERDLVIERISRSCNCTRAETDAQTVSPGASTTLRVEVRTPGAPGAVEHRVLVRSNDPEEPLLEILLHATVVAETR